MSGLIEKRVCIIGAGSSGLPVVKALRERGIPFDCFERSDRVGGNWAFRNPNGMSSIYRSLHTNSSRTRTEYAAFPMPPDYPDFPHHSQMAAYFESYADHFGLNASITFGTTVGRAERYQSGWAVTLDSGETRHYGVLIVANGHHWDPRWPKFPLKEQFGGEIIHAHDYIDPHEPVSAVGKRVVVIGLGNSAMDIASELSRPGVAEKVYLSVRRGAWILPKSLFGRPVDRLSVTHPLVPWRVQSLFARLMLWLTAPAAPWQVGLPRPDHPPLGAHPTISQHILEYLKRGEIIVKPPIASLEGHEVRFQDGTREKADLIVCCTGYKISFPFFDPAFLSAPGNDLPLWRRIVRPHDRDLFFVGLLQPVGAVMPLAEAQAELIAAYLAGGYDFPAPATMRAEVERERAAVAQRYVGSERHTMQVDFDRYLYDLKRELSAGRQRRSQAGAG